MVECKEHVMSVHTVLAGQCEYPSTLNNSTSSTINIAAPALAHSRSALLSPKINSLEPDVCVTLPWPVCTNKEGLYREFQSQERWSSGGELWPEATHSQQNVPDAECPSHFPFLSCRIYLQIHFTKINL